MSNEEMVGRMAALEVIAMTALGLHFGQHQQRPSPPKVWCPACHYAVVGIDAPSQVTSPE